ncbi:hypothetical protein AGMMS50239_38230 [Bacteroidia bacterium]|nr:hypothetical protein AGMMS50239_38230 [Bacteroidia bacterium]
MSNQENLLILINQGSDNAESLENTVLNIRSVDNKKITDHHALLITENRPGELSEDERTLYEMIAGRMLESFSGKCKKENTVISLTSADIAFSARGSVMLAPGWRGVFNSQDEEKEEDATLLPAVAQGDRLTVSDCGVLEKQTKPRPIHTEASQLSSMEQAGRELENEDEREAMKDAGIGTPATRAGIIETLLLREYMRREKKSLVPTEKGLVVYQAVKDKKIADAAMTGSWENALSKIETGKMSAATFHKEIEIYAAQITAELLETKIEGQGSGKWLTVPCPKCKTGHVVFFPKVAKCDNAGCGLLVFRGVAGRELTDSHPLLANDAAFIAACVETATEAYNNAIRDGLPHNRAEELANVELYRELLFSPYNTIVNIIWNEFAAEIPEDDAREAALLLLPLCSRVLEKYSLSDDFAETPEYYLLYTELTGTIQILLEDGIQ